MIRSQLIGGAFHYSRWPLSHFLDEMNKLGIEAIEFYAASPHLYLMTILAGWQRLYAGSWMMPVSK